MKNFNFRITIKIATILLILSGCGSVDTTTSQQDTNETEVLGIKETQIEQNSTLVREETNQRDTEIVNSQYLEPEQSDTSEISQPIETTSTATTNEIVSVVKELDYTTKFINEENCNQILDKEFLLICYDYNLKVAKSVAYTLYGDLVNELNIQDRPSFHIEREIDEEYRASTDDYTNTGYDRGHLAPDASFDWSAESLDSTYSLANIIPQVPVVNRHMWVKAESYARDKAIELFELNVVNVIRYSNSPQHIGENSISVSIGYYKMLFNIDKEYEECFYYANELNASSENDQLENHVVDCTKIKA